MEALFNSNKVWQEMGVAVGHSGVVRVFKSDADSPFGILRVLSVGVELALRASQCKCFLCLGLPDREAVTLKRLSWWQARFCFYVICEGGRFNALGRTDNTMLFNAGSCATRCNVGVQGFVLCFRSTDTVHPSCSPVLSTQCVAHLCEQANTIARVECRDPVFALHGG